MEAEGLSQAQSTCVSGASPTSASAKCILKELLGKGNVTKTRICKNTSLYFLLLNPIDIKSLQQIVKRFSFLHVLSWTVTFCVCQLLTPLTQPMGEAVSRSQRDVLHGKHEEVCPKQPATQA